MIGWEILAILLLCAPLLWECTDDLHGDKNKSRDVIVRWLIAVFIAVVIMVMGYFNMVHRHGFWPSFCLSLSIHFAIFDYIIAYLLIKNGVIDDEFNHWFTYMGKRGYTDNIKWWRNLNPWIKLFVRGIPLIISILFYV